MNKLNARRGGLLAVVAALSLLGATTIAHGERVIKGNIVISFHGNISPSKLPRKDLAPVGVQMGAKISTVDGLKPPRLTKLVLDINSKGVIDAKGLPTCSIGKLLNSSSAQAKALCGEAEVGSGNVTLRIQFPGQGEFASNGPLVAFNGKSKGKQAILAHIDSKGKLNSTEVLTFIVKKGKGTFGTTLTADVGNIASGNGYISAFDLSLRRRYSSRGDKKSFVSARCPLPPDVPVANFQFARSTYYFEDGTKVASTLTKQCRAKG
jgi:hypothetical protein